MEWKERITNSERSCAGCLQKWFYRYGLSLTTASRPVQLYRGILWHEAIERLAQPHWTLDNVLTWLDTELDIHLGKTGPGYLSTADETAEVFMLVRNMLIRYHAHWSAKPAQEWSVIECEQAVRCRVRHPTTGRRSTATGFEGRLDKLVIPSIGQEVLKLGDNVEANYWLGEHKSTVLPLDEWWRRNLYKPQAPAYAWALRETTGITVRGVIYDLAYAKLPKPACEFDVLKGGKRMAKPGGRGLPLTTAANWAEAVRMNGFKSTDEDWYVDLYKKLRDRDRSNFWFWRRAVPMTVDEIDRAGQELYHVATTLRRHKCATEPLRQRVIDAAGDPSALAREIVDICKEHGTKYPRNFSQCWLYNKKCRWMDLCRYQTIEAAGAFVLDEAIDRYADLEDED